MRASLFGLKGVMSNKNIPLEEGKPLIIGRGENATLRLPDTGISRMHAIIEIDKGVPTVEDMGSRNGTWVNGKKIARVRLSHYDTICLGEQELRFETDHEPPTKLVEMQDDQEPAVDERIKLPTDEILYLAPTERTDENFRRLQENLSTIYRVGNLVNAEEDLDALLELIMDAVMEVIKADRGDLLLAERETRELRQRVSRHRRTVPSDMRSAYSTTVVKQCFEEGYSIVCADTSKDDQISVSESVGAQNIRSIVCVPLQAGKEVLGVIYADSVLGSRRFTKHDLEILTAIGNQAGVAVRRAQMKEEMERMFYDFIKVLISTLETRDPATMGHAQRVAEVAGLIAHKMALTPAEFRTVQLAAILHDLGKLGVTLEILNKPSSLSPEEYDNVKEHAALGAKIIDKIPHAAEIAQAVRHHHERWDGTGYPDRLAGQNIPLAARILAVADAFDSLVASRPYKDPISVEEAVREVRRSAETHFDPQVVAAFLDLDSSGKLAGFAASNHAAEIDSSSTILEDLSTRKYLDPKKPPAEETDESPAS
ncbi:MAG TPA: HD domain-containing phosphohydrolase [Candidatus Brocadiia bacterium]|nr:HD domain-containing phosphohydrolase [Candidatus Brocadiia bacterium]